MRDNRADKGRRRLVNSSSSSSDWALLGRGYGGTGGSRSNIFCILALPKHCAVASTEQNVNPRKKDFQPAIRTIGPRTILVRIRLVFLGSFERVPLPRSLHRVDANSLLCLLFLVLGVGHVGL